MTPPPDKPASLNGDHEALWGFMQHLEERMDSRVDKLMVMIVGFSVVQMGVLVGALQLIGG